MELHERLTTTRPTTTQGAREPFAELKTQVHLTVIGDLGPQLFNVTMDPAALRERVIVDIRRHLAGETTLSRDDRERLSKEIADDILGYGPLERLLADDSISEIMVNGPGDIWIERQGRLFETTVRFNDDSHLRRIINKMVAQVGRRVDESSPMVDARLPDGSRVNVIIPPLSLSGPLVTIRKFSKKRLTLDDMVNLGTISAEAVEFLRACVRAELNILISGGTGTGKTTLLNALSSAIPEADRIVTIEDAAELQLHQEHVLRLEARPKNIEGEGEIAIRELVRNSLRMRPDRIIVGEVRGAEALDMLQSMNTGHEGSMSTVARELAARRAPPHRDDGADGRLRPPGARDPAAGLVGPRPHRPPRPARGRLAPRLAHHRGAADGVRRDHAAGPVRRSSSSRSRPTARSPASSGRPGSGRCSWTSSRSTASSCRRASSDRRPSQLSEIVRGGR